MYKEKYLSVIVAAGGMGTRFGLYPGSEDPKQFMDIGGRSMIMAAAEPFFDCGFADEIIYVVPMGYSRYTCNLIVHDFTGFWTKVNSAKQELVVEYGGREVAVKVVHGGLDRAASVRAGLDAAREDPAGSLVLIHDAARPFVSEDLILRVLEAAYEHGAAVPVTHVSDTVYVADEGGFAAGIPDREKVRRVQTPQGFDLSLIREAHKHALAEGITTTDDGTPVFADGVRVALVEGDKANVKITFSDDLPDHSFLYHEASGLRAGIGFDAHRFVEGRALVLGGVQVPHDKGLLGHSDADVLTHALMDAILGALHEGDIGKLFPDTDPAFERVSSQVLLSEVVSIMDKRGFEIGNVDLMIVAERPRMAPYCGEIEKRLAETLRTSPENVSLKATTTERLGFTGREEGMAAEAVVLLKKKEDTKGGEEE